MNNNKTIKIKFENYILLDKLRELAFEYATTTDFIVNVAVKKLIDDIEFMRGLRTGKIKISTVHHRAE